MGLFDRLAGGKRKKEQEARENAESLLDYSGMRVEVYDAENTLLFVARLSITPGGLVQLHQLSAGGEGLDAAPFPVTVRGFFEAQKLAVHMSGTASWVSDRLWRVEEFRVTSKENDRAFFRQGIDTSGEVTRIGTLGSQACPCEVVNISAGGVCIHTSEQFGAGNLLVLRSRLLPDQDLPPVMCEVRRVTEKKKGLYEYGCQFVDLHPAMEDQIARAIVELQRQKLRL